VLTDGAAGVVPALREGPLRDRDGLLLGRVDEVLYDAETNRPAWLVVRLADGAAGATRRTLAPARGLRFFAGGGGCALGCEAIRVHECPVTLSGPLLTREHVAAAARHYGVRRFLRGDALTTAGRAVVDDGTARASLAVAS
jgi:hypothetical protein